MRFFIVIIVLLFSIAIHADGIRQVDSFEFTKSQCAERILERVKEENALDGIFKLRSVDGQWVTQPLTAGDLRRGEVLYEKNTFWLEEYPSIVCRTTRSKEHGYQIKSVGRLSL